MPDYIVAPYVGIGPVLLGMSRIDVANVMTELPRPRRRRKANEAERDSFPQSGLYVYYAANSPTVEYLEMSPMVDFRALYGDIDIFGTPAEDVVTYIARNAAFDSSMSEFPYTYIFRSLQLSLWRPTIPESGTDREGRYFSSVGLGTSGYYDHVA